MTPPTPPELSLFSSLTSPPVHQIFLSFICIGSSPPYLLSCILPSGRVLGLGVLRRHNFSLRPDFLVSLTHLPGHLRIPKVLCKYVSEIYFTVSLHILSTILSLDDLMSIVSFFFTDSRVPMEDNSPLFFSFDRIKLYFQDTFLT